MDNLGGTDGPGDENLGVLVPGNYIDLFALELVDYALDSVASHSDTGAHRVNSLLGGVNRHLAPLSRLPRDGLDLDHAVVNFRHLNLKKALEHILVTSGNQDCRPLGGGPHIQHVNLESLALLVPFGGHLLLWRHDRVGPSQVQGHGATVLHVFNYAGDNILFVLDKLFVEEFSLGFPQPLQHHLLGCLRGDAAGIVG